MRLVERRYYMREPRVERISNRSYVLAVRPFFILTFTFADNDLFVLVSERDYHSDVLCRLLT
jgi:hypothetical protein